VRRDQARLEADLGIEVTGISCPRGHVNPDRSRYCSLCGTALGNADPAVGPRPVIGALVRADGIRVLLREEIALTSCGPRAAADTATPVVARIVFLGWEPFALAQTPGVRWAPPTGPVVPLEPGDSAPLRPGATLLVGLDAYRYEPVDHATEPRPRRSRRRRRRPARSLFRREESR